MIECNDLAFENNHYYSFQRSNIANQLDVSPWGDQFDLKQHKSIQIAKKPKKQIKKPSLSLNRYINKRMIQADLPAQRISLQIHSISKTIDQCDKQQSTQSKYIFHRVLQTNPFLKRLTHLPVLSARQQYGQIFKYTKPEVIKQSSTKSLPKYINLKQELPIRKRQKHRNQLILSLQEQQKALIIDEQNEKLRRIKVNHNQLLPSIDKFLHRNKKCVKVKQRQLRQKIKSSYYRHL